MEQERTDGWGKVIVTAHPRVPKGVFSLCVREGEKLMNIVTGPLDSLGDSFVANGQARDFSLRGIDVYYVFNPDDLQDENIRKQILPKGMNLKKD